MIIALIIQNITLRINGIINNAKAAIKLEYNANVNDSIIKLELNKYFDFLYN